jgi:hypothetical protein
MSGREPGFYILAYTFETTARESARIFLGLHVDYFVQIFRRNVSGKLLGAIHAINSKNEARKTAGSE